MRRITLAIITGVITTSSLFARTNRTCDTTYVGPPGGSWKIAENWDNGIPDAEDVACFPDTAAGRVGSPNPPSGTREGTAAGVIPALIDPPLPGTVGACCLGSSCLVTDWFDCREQGGYMKMGIPVCDPSVCSTGVCCEDDPSCTADDGLGGPMDESLCDLIGGSYIGGAACDDRDPCQQYRLPAGFELIEIHSAEDRNNRPRINNCGEVVFPLGAFFEPWSEIYHYDNGKLTQVTDNDIPEGFPDINDHGQIVFRREADIEDSIVMLDDGIETTLYASDALGPPVINSLGHVAWEKRAPAGCELSEAVVDIWLFDGLSTWEFYADGLSNQGVALNDFDQVIWTNYTFPCGGTFSDWRSDILLYVEPDILSLPSETEPRQIQGPDLDHAVRAGWTSVNWAEIWENGVTTPLYNEENTSGVSLNDRGDVAFTFKLPNLPWEIWLRRDGKFHVIADNELFRHITPDINEVGEIAWRWHDILNPSGIRMMRRIRNGDVNSDGLVDLGDFVDMPGCYTGPETTDGLCECRFFDIDHDRDVDTDDYDFFLRNYAGPLEDCNGNKTTDLDELLFGSATDCNLNGRIDGCDLADDPGLDTDGDGAIDSCCLPIAPVVEMIGGQVSIKNRYLSFTTDDILPQAIRLAFVDLPEPFDVLNGQSMWVGEPQEVSENGSTVEPIPGFSNFWAATLSCTPHYTDWGALDTIHIYHEGIVPEGTYAIQVINQGCGEASELNFSSALTITNALWGDTIKDCQNTPCAPPDGLINIVDIVAIVGRFLSAPDSIIKARADLEPATPDLQINITDLLAGLTGFQGVAYPFALSDPDPCGP